MVMKYSIYFQVHYQNKLTIYYKKYDCQTMLCFATWERILCSNSNEKYIDLHIYIARIMLILKVPNLNLIYSQKCQSVMQVQNLILWHLPITTLLSFFTWLILLSKCNFRNDRTLILNIQLMVGTQQWGVRLCIG